MSTRRTSLGKRAARAPARAFSLTEILIAMAILVIGMVGVIACFSSAIELHKRGVDQTSAALLAETILEIKQAEALAGFTADEISTREGGSYVFERSENYTAYECKIICTELNEREYKMIVEVRLHPQAARRGTSSDTEEESENVRLETILLRQ